MELAQLLLLLTVISRAHAKLYLVGFLGLEALRCQQHFTLFYLSEVKAQSKELI
jgi:hypothetical protein